MLDWIVQAIHELMAAVGWLTAQLRLVWQFLGEFVDWIWEGLLAIARTFEFVGRVIWRGFRALGHLNFRSIWNGLKRIYQRYCAALDWWNRHVMGPIERMRAQIMQVYRIFFAPIIRLLDTFRVGVRFIALFNRRLAQRLDSRLMALEGLIMAPIRTMLRRLNSLASYHRALITASGRLSRSVLLATLARDASCVWEVLTNPRALFYSPPTLPPPPGLAEMSADLEVYVTTGGGPLADAVDRLQEVAERFERET